MLTHGAELVRGDRAAGLPAAGMQQRSGAVELLRFLPSAPFFCSVNLRKALRDGTSRGGSTRISQRFTLPSTGRFYRFLRPRASG